MKNAIIHISFIVLTILFASKASLIQENFTGIANNLGHYQALIGWSIIAACYFYRYSMCLFKRLAPQLFKTCIYRNFYRYFYIRLYPLQ